MTKKIVLLIIVLTSFKMFSQLKYSKTITTFGLPIRDNLMTYTTYPDSFLIGVGCDSYENCKNEFPEQTLMSIISANNYEWDKKNYNYEIKNNEKKYNFSKNLEKNKYYFKLLRKLSFETNGQKYAIIKYNIRENDKIIPICNILTQENNKWFVLKSEGSLTKAYLMFSYLSTNSLDALFKNKKINIFAFDEQTAKAYATNKLDFSKAINSTSSSEMGENDLKVILDKSFFDQSLEASDKAVNTIEKLDLNKLIDLQIPANYVKELDHQVLFKYEKDDYRDFETDSEAINLISQTGSAIVEINPILRFTFKIDGKLYTIFKFSKKINENELTTKLFINENNEWKIVNASPKDVEAFYKTFSSIKLNFLQNIINVGNDNKFPEINNLKSSFKDENGILNIYKLANTIEKNKVLLSKYLDN
jgi:hypothetical protein